jgi:Tfp pilus assembly protein PilX
MEGRGDGLIMAKNLNKMNRNNNVYTKKREKGFVLVLTLFAALIMSALIIAFVNIQTIDLNLIKNNLGSKKAYYIAEAGIADAIDQLRQNGPFAVEDAPQWQKNFPLDTSADSYSVSVSTITDDGAGNGRNSMVITSTGHASASNFTRALEVKVAFFHSSTPYVVAIEQWKEITP